MRLVWISIMSAAMACSALAQQARSSSGDWSMLGRDLAGTRYSPLAQINVKNVATLTEAWSYQLQDELSVTDATPIVVHGVMYVPTAQADRQASRHLGVRCRAL